jgi:hypothetical protein
LSLPGSDAIQGEKFQAIVRIDDDDAALANDENLAVYCDQNDPSNI